MVGHKVFSEKNNLVFRYVAIHKSTTTMYLLLAAFHFRNFRPRGDFGSDDFDVHSATQQKRIQTILKSHFDFENKLCHEHPC